MTNFPQAPEGFKRLPSGLLVPGVERRVSDKILGKGTYIGQIIRKGEVIDEFSFDNIVVNQGLNYLANAGLGGGSVITTWYIGLFTGNYTVLATDTAAGIAAAATETGAYTAGARQAWSPATATTQSITNSASQASFTFNAGITVYGGFLVSSATVNGTAGTLFSGAQFGAAKAVVSTDILLLTYTYNLASA